MSQKSFYSCKQGVFKLRVINITSKSKAESEKYIKSSTIQQFSVSSSLSGISLNLPTNGSDIDIPHHQSDKTTSLHFKLCQKQVLHKGGSSQHQFESRIVLDQENQQDSLIPLVHDVKYQQKLILNPIMHHNAPEIWVSHYELVIQIKYIAAAVQNCPYTGLKLGDDQFISKNSTTPYIIQINNFRFQGLSSFFQSNNIEPGEQADYFLVFTQSIQYKDSTNKNICQVKLTKDMIRDTQQFFTCDLSFYTSNQSGTKLPQFYIAIAEKPKIKYATRSHQAFLTAIQQVVKNKNFADNYFKNFHNKNFSECLEDKQDFYYDENAIDIILVGNVNIQSDLGEVRVNIKNYQPNFSKKFDNQLPVQIQLTVNAYSNNLISHPFGRLLLDLKPWNQFKLPNSLYFESVKKPVLIIQTGQSYSSGSYLGVSQEKASKNQNIQKKKVGPYSFLPQEVASTFKSRTINWICEDTGNPKLIEFNCLGASQRVDIFLFSESVSQQNMVGCNSLSIMDFIKGFGDTTYLPIFSNKFEDVIGYLKFAYKFQRFNQDLLVDYQDGWQDIVFQPHQSIIKSNIMQRYCKNEFAMNIPIGNLYFTLLKLKNIGDFLNKISKIRKFPQSPVILSVKVNGDCKYFNLSQLQGQSSKKHNRICFRTTSHQDKIEFDLLELKQTSTADLSPQLLKKITKLIGSKIDKSSIRTIKHDVLALSAFLSCTYDGVYYHDIVVQDFTSNTQFTLLSNLSLQFQLGYSPSLPSQQHKIPIGAIINQNFAVLGMQLQTIAVEKGYKGSQYSMNLCKRVNEQNPKRQKAFQRYNQVVKAEQALKKQANNNIFVISFNQGESQLQLDVSEIRNQKRVLVFSHVVSFKTASNIDSSFGEGYLCLWNPMTLRFDCMGEQIKVGASNTNPNISINYDTSRSFKAQNTGMASSKLSETLIAYKRTGKLPRSPNAGRTPRSESGVGFNSSRYSYGPMNQSGNYGRRTSTIKRLSTTNRNIDGSNLTPPLQFLFKISCITSDFIRCSGSGIVHLYFDQVSLLQLYQNQIINEQSTCKVQLISRDQRCFGQKFQISILDIDTAIPFKIKTFEIDDVITIALKTKLPDLSEQGREPIFLENKVALKLITMPLNCDTSYLHHVIIGNQNLSISLQFEKRYQSLKMLSGKNLDEEGDIFSLRAIDGKSNHEKAIFSQILSNNGDNKNISKSNMSDVILELKNQINKVKQQNKQLTAHLHRQQNQNDLSKRRIKQLKNIKLQDPRRAIDSKTFLQDIQRMKNLMSGDERKSNKQSEQENITVNLQQANEEYKQNLKKQFIKAFKEYEPVAQEYQKYSEDQKTFVLEKKQLMKRKIQKMKGQLSSVAQKKLNIQDFIKREMTFEQAETRTLRTEVASLQNNIKYNESQFNMKLKDFKERNSFLQTKIRKKLLTKDKIEEEIKEFKMKKLEMENKLKEYQIEIIDKKGILHQAIDEEAQFEQQ